MRPILPALLAVTLAVPAFAGWSRTGGFHPGALGARRDSAPLAPRFEARAQHLARLLELTAAQRDAFDRLRAEGLVATRPKLDEMRRLHEELRSLLDSGAADAQRVGDTLIALRRTRDDLQARREGFADELAEILTAEQRFAFEALRELRHDRDSRFGPGPRLGRRDGRSEPPGR